MSCHLVVRQSWTGIHLLYKNVASTVYRTMRHFGSIPWPHYSKTKRGPIGTIDLSSGELLGQRLVVATCLLDSLEVLGELWYRCAAIVMWFLLANRVGFVLPLLFLPEGLHKVSISHHDHVELDIEKSFCSWCSVFLSLLFFGTMGGSSKRYSSH